MKRTIAAAIVLALVLSLALPAAALAKRGGVPARGSGRGHTPATVSGEDGETGEPDAVESAPAPVPDESKDKGKGRANRPGSIEPDDADAEQDGEEPKPSWETTPTGIQNAYSRVLRNLERRLDRGKFLPPGLLQVFAKFAGWLGIEMPVAEEAVALSWLQDNTSLSGSLGELVATFPDTIPAEVVEGDYKIDSRITLAEALPPGTTVSVWRDGELLLDGIELTGTGPFWFTELFEPDAPRADFDADYAGKTETYGIVVSGPDSSFTTTLTIESVISKDGFASETVLASIVLPVMIDSE